MEETNPLITRALRLYQTSRYEQAMELLHLALNDNPDDPLAHALLALCFVESKDFSKARREAELAVHLAPDYDFAHAALAEVHLEANRFPECISAIEDALMLDPYSSSYLGILSAAHYNQEHWNEALSAANRGLEIDPESEQCNNMRAMSLTKLGRKSEATATTRATLKNNPESSDAHAVQGWNELHSDNPKQALVHFQEALRIDAESELARSGMLQALRARYFFYRWILAYFLWMSTLSSQVRWGILLGGYFGIQFLGGIAKANPGLAPFLLPIQVVYVAFALMTWISASLLDLTLLFNRFGRHILTGPEKVTSIVLAFFLLGSIGGLVAHYGFDYPRGIWMALVFGLCTPAICTVKNCAAGWPRNTMFAIAIGVIALGMASFIPQHRPVAPEPHDLLTAISIISTLLFFFAAIASQFAANYLASVTPRQ